MHRAESRPTVKIRLLQIRHNHAGFKALVRLFAKTEECLFEDIEIDMTWTGWFDADMCAPFGAWSTSYTWMIRSIKTCESRSA